MSDIVDFYTLRDSDSAGRQIEDMWAASDEWLEECHNHIQWLFPTTEPSAYNPNAPLLTADDISTLQNNAVAKAALTISFTRMLRFYGLEWQDGLSVVEGLDFAEKQPKLFDGFNHNHLRITRILTSLLLLNAPSMACSLFFYLSGKKELLPVKSYDIWEAVMRV